MIITSLTFEKFVGMTEPFRKRRLIYFTERSSAHTAFGEKVYGCFLQNKAYRYPDNIIVEDQFLKIDAQVLNGHNTQLGDLRMTLLFKGVHFSNIDIERSFPEWNEI